MFVYVIIRYEYFLYTWSFLFILPFHSNDAWNTLIDEAAACDTISMLFFYYFYTVKSYLIDQFISDFSIRPCDAFICNSRQK